jgi:hypothetical protein
MLVRAAAQIVALQVSCWLGCGWHETAVSGEMLVQLRCSCRPAAGWAAAGTKNSMQSVLVQWRVLPGVQTTCRGVGAYWHMKAVVSVHV